MNYGEITWSANKNRVLQRERGVCFEDVESAILQGNVIADVPHHLHEKYPHQRMLIVLIEGYVFNVPYVKSEQGIFLKTLYASRKSMKLYCNKNYHG